MADGFATSFFCRISRTGLQRPRVCCGGLQQARSVGEQQKAQCSSWGCLVSYWPLAHLSAGALEAAPRGRDLLKLAHCRSFVPASALRPASSKEGYPTGKRSLCSSSRARSVPARVEVNRQNPCPKMQKLWKLVPLSRVERATRAHIARQERATTLRRALLQPLRCPGKNQGCVQHKHPQAIAAPGSRHRPGRRDTSA